MKNKFARDKHIIEKSRFKMDHLGILKMTKNGGKRKKIVTGVEIINE